MPEQEVIKVCFVCPKAYPLFNPSIRKLFGGAELDLYLLACELAKGRRYEVSCIVADYGQDDIEIIKNIKVYKSVDFKKNSLSGAKRIWQAMKKANADIYVQETASPGTILVSLFCKINNRRFIYRTAHQHELDGTYFRTNRLSGKGFKWALKNASFVIVQNEQDRELAGRNIGVDSKVIRNAHELPITTQDDKDIILWVGRSASFKRPELFLKIAKRTPDEHFVMICQHATGDDEYDNLRKEAQETSNLEFIEHVPFEEVIKYFNKAKVYVNTSDSEGFANTFVDACKSAAPIMSLSVNPDNFIDTNECGLCAKGNWENFLELFDNLRKNSKEILRLGSNGRKYMEENHDISKIIDIYKDLFENAVNLCVKSM
jgi:glycosyltransferase involved in cell wall biosynthesis